MAQSLVREAQGQLIFTFTIPAFVTTVSLIVTNAQSECFAGIRTNLLKSCLYEWLVLIFSSDLCLEIAGDILYSGCPIKIVQAEISALVVLHILLLYDMSVCWSFEGDGGGNMLLAEPLVPGFRIIAATVCKWINACALSRCSNSIATVFILLRCETSFKRQIRHIEALPRCTHWEYKLCRQQQRRNNFSGTQLTKPCSVHKYVSSYSPVCVCECGEWAFLYKLCCVVSLHFSVLQSSAGKLVVFVDGV